MKKFNLSLVAVLAMSTFAIAGGDIAPVEPVVEAPMVIEEDTSAFYVGIGYSGMEIDLDTDFLSINKQSDTFNQILLQAGYKFNDYIAVEGRYAFGTDDSDWSYFSHQHPLLLSQNVSADSWNIFVKPMYPVTDSFDVYALLGYGETSFDYGFNDTSFGDTGGFAWGLGVDYSFTENISVFVDYTDQSDNSTADYILTRSGQLVPANFDIDFDSWSVGITYSF